MSLFSAVGDAIGGVGAGLTQVGQMDAATDLENQRAAIQRDRDVLVNKLRMQADTAQTAGQTQAYKDKATFDSSPDQVNAAAGKAGAIAGAEAKGKSDNTPLKMSPGETAMLPNANGGTEVASNDNPTSADAYMPGMKGTNTAAAAAREAAKEAAAARKQASDEFFKLTDRKNFTDPNTGAVDSARWSAVTALGKKELDSNPNTAPSEAVSAAQAAYDKAQQFADQITPVERSVGHPFTGAKDPAATTKLARQIVANMTSGMDPTKVFDPSTYDPSKKSAAQAPSASASSSSAASSAATAPASAATSAPAASVVPGDIPDPPPQMVQQGLRTVPNPAYLDWQLQYGDAYAKQTGSRSLIDQAAALDAKKRYNPYAQPRVP